MMRHKHSSRHRSAWMREHLDDPHVKRAKAEGWRSRAVYKLKEIDEKDHLIRPGMQVLELGAAPGGWSQYIAHRLEGRGRIIALDILPMDNVPDVEFMQGDFTEQAVERRLKDVLSGNPCDLVVSDMNPNMSGVKAVDQPGSIYLAELALQLALEVLHFRGIFLVKVFQGEGFDTLMADMKRRFGSVRSRKPQASRPRSREIYLLAKGIRRA